jgi:hypothetical protein
MTKRFSVKAVQEGAPTEVYALNALLAGLEDLGFGTDNDINGADAVDAIGQLYADVTQRIMGGVSLKEFGVPKEPKPPRMRP